MIFSKCLFGVLCEIFLSAIWELLTVTLLSLIQYILNQCAVSVGGLIWCKLFKFQIDAIWRQTSSPMDCFSIVLCKPKKPLKKRCKICLRFSKLTNQPFFPYYHQNTYQKAVPIKFITVFKKLESNYTGTLIKTPESHILTTSLGQHWWNKSWTNRRQYFPE